MPSALVVALVIAGAMVSTVMTEPVDTSGVAGHIGGDGGQRDGAIDRPP